jgi:hypothetical protein
MNKRFVAYWELSDRMADFESIPFILNHVDITTPSEIHEDEQTIWHYFKQPDGVIYVIEYEVI